MLKESLPKHTDPLSPNLFQPESEKPTFRETVIRVQNSLFVKFPIVAIQTILLLVIGFNYFLNKNIDAHTKIVAALAQSIEQFEGVDLRAQEVSQKIALYKHIKQLQPQITEKATFLIKNIPAEIVLKRFAYENGVINMSAQVSNPFSLAMLISKYFDRTDVREIVIKSAVFDSSQEVFVINFDVVFK